MASAQIAEASAILEAITQASISGWKKLQINSDSLSLVKAINLGTGNKETSGIIADIVNFAAHFETISFSYVSRNQNVTVDGLAKAALSSSALRPSVFEEILV